MQQAAPRTPMPQPLELDKLEPAVREPPTTTRNPFTFGVQPRRRAPAGLHAAGRDASSAAPAADRSRRRSR